MLRITGSAQQILVYCVHYEVFISVVLGICTKYMYKSPSLNVNVTSSLYISMMCLDTMNDDLFNTLKRYSKPGSV